MSNETVRRIITEVSKRLLRRYVKKAKSQLDSGRAPLTGSNKSKEKDLGREYRRYKNRFTGVERAAERGVKEDIDEAYHSKGGGKKGGLGAKGQETEGEDHPIVMARKAVSLGLSKKFKHQNKKTTEITTELGHKILDRHDRLNKPSEKEHMTKQLSHSPEHLHDYLKGVHHNYDKQEPSMPGGWKPAKRTGSTGGAYGAARMKGKQAQKHGAVNEPKKQYRPD